MAERDYPKITVTWDPEVDTALVIWGGETPDHFETTSDPFVSTARSGCGRIVGFMIKGLVEHAERHCSELTGRAEQYYAKVVRLSPGEDRRTGPVDSPPCIVRVCWDSVSDSMSVRWCLGRWGLLGISSDWWIWPKNDMDGHVTGFMIEDIRLCPTRRGADLLPNSEQERLDIPAKVGA